MKNSGLRVSGIDEFNSKLWKNRYDNPSDTLRDATLLLAKAEKEDYQRGMAYARLNIAVCNFLQSKNDIAFENLSEGLFWFSEHTAEPGYAIALNLKGNIYESFGEYEKALQNALEAHKYATDIKDLETEAEASSTLGMIYTRLCNFKKALDYYKEGLEIREEMKDENAVASSLNRIGMIMRLTGKYEESLEYYQRSLDIRKQNNQTTSIPWTMLGIASTYEEMKKPAEALGCYEQGMTGGDIRCTLQCLMGSGRILSTIGEKVKAEERLEESLKLAGELKALSLVAEAYSALANHYESTGDTEKALFNHKLYHKTRESVQSDESKSKLRNIEIAHAIEKSEQEKEIFRLRHVELKQAYDIIEEKNKDITASINYASRIQNAMLTNPGEIRGFKKNCFIFYQPKDIVSGDFYWFTKTGSKLVVVAADCTGHGVPGALMSMLGISFLEEIVNNREITDSALILNELRKEIIWALHKNSKCQDTKDGMDISLCIVDQAKRIIQFSGAYNNLYLISNNELSEFKADRMPIGLSDFKNISFTSQDIPYSAGDFIYMFSDGYADQFGGPVNKKFRYSTLRSLLTEIHKLSPLKQKQILEKRFNEWKGVNTQIDDVLLLGIKL